MPQKEDSSIYLRGVKSQEMKSILQFMYLGQATFYQDRMNDFLNVAKSLEIKEISKDVNHDLPDLPNDQEYDKNIEPNIGNLHEENNILSQGNVKGDLEHTSSNLINQINEVGQYPCNRCDKHYTYKHHLNRHIQSTHEGIKFPCNECGYEARTMKDLKRHIQSVHEGIKFPCEFCDFKATRKDHLHTHKKNKH